MYDLWKNLNRLTEESLVGLSLADRADERDIEVRIYCKATFIERIIRCEKSSSTCSLHFQQKRRKMIIELFEKYRDIFHGLFLSSSYAYEIKFFFVGKIFAEPCKFLKKKKKEK